MRAAARYSAPLSWSNSQARGIGFNRTFSSCPTDRREIIGEKQVLGAPDLVVEIPSPSTARRDRGIKLDLYARCGVREYWIVDPVEDAVDVWCFRDDPGHERFAGELPVRLGAERLGRIDLAEVFSRHLDQWGGGGE